VDERRAGSGDVDRVGDGLAVDGKAVHGRESEDFPVEFDRPVEVPPR
jgi:hypothetical protein